MTLLIAPIEALTDSRLSDPERRVLLALYSFRNKNANTVWPSVPALAERANINDHTRISKLTKSLADKGWLTKKKRGFTGGNEYTLMVPETPNSNLDSETNLAPETNLEPDTNSNLDSETKSNLDSDAKYKEQQIEHQIEQGAKVQKVKNPKVLPRPTVEEISEYCRERGNGIDPEAFFHYYETRGWKLPGGQAMKSWKSAVITWEKRSRSEQKQTGPRELPGI